MDWTSITRRLFLFLPSGMFAKYGLANTSAIEPEDQALSAKQILDRMAKTYAKCKAYQDSGCVTTVFIRANGQHTSKKPFTTAFVRPDRFRFEFKDSFDEQNWFRYLVWANGRDVRTWWDLKARLKRPSSLPMGLAGATGVSGGSAHTVPSLLMPDSITGWSLRDLTQLRRLENAKLGDVDCFRLQGKLVIKVDPAEEKRRRREEIKRIGRASEAAERGPTVIWIDRTTSLVRRIDERTKFESFRTERTTSYEPMANESTAERQLVFDPPKK